MNNVSYKNNRVTSISQLRVQEKKDFLLFFSHHQEAISLFSSTLAQDCFHLVTQWLLRAWHRRVISSPVTCQSVIIDSAMSTVFVSFDFPLIDEALPICNKIETINNLLKTIQQVSPSFQSVYLLVRHEPMIDKHIDSIRPLAISGYSFTSF
jgi:hypothetical protein